LGGLPLIFEGSQLLLNVKTTGWAKVAIADRVGAELPGFGLADCDAIKADATARRVTWRGGADVSNLKGKAVRLRFQMPDAQLYTFEFKK